MAHAYEKRCTNCRHKIQQIVKLSEGSNNLRHALCPNCNNIADKYAISRCTLYSDLFLFKTEAYMHLVFNSQGSHLERVLFIRMIILLINTLDRSIYFSLSDVLISITAQVSEIIITILFLHRSMPLRRILHVTTVLSVFSLVKPFIFLASHPISSTYYQMCNILGYMMLSKALSVYLLWNTQTVLTFLVVLRITTGFVFYGDVQI
ncbi:hypothetical protein NEAUS05_1515 [Nematocida ausubeli]|nr:hypothetical protein NEAUS07_1362 [Nematocida ausubeli]KAI5148756.1 hypothetical protein NEAUS05_1515 [Nematocida ausubeli]